MAIDFMIMPLSRYLAGDFVTPAMQASWEQGLVYCIIGPDGSEEKPPGVPYGGADAGARRARFATLRDALDDATALQLPLIVDL